MKIDAPTVGIMQCGCDAIEQEITLAEFQIGELQKKINKLRLDHKELRLAIFNSDEDNGETK